MDTKYCLLKWIPNNKYYILKIYENKNKGDISVGSLDVIINLLQLSYTIKDIVFAKITLEDIYEKYNYEKINEYSSFEELYESFISNLIFV